MRCNSHIAALLLLLALVAATSARQLSPSSRKHSAQSVLLNTGEGLSVIGAALESRGRAHFKPDCSHLAHSVYERAGFPYSYESSSDLYRGVPEFRRVMHPQPGDLVAWPGHVGIVVNPSQNTFYSSLRTGLGVDSYAAPYWMKRGPHRFYRYSKASH